MGSWSNGPVQGEILLSSADLPRSPGHPFYDKLNPLLAEAVHADTHLRLRDNPYRPGRGEPRLKNDDPNPTPS
jgi:hypothetical protein